MFRKLFIVILIPSMLLSACNFTISLPVTQKAGPTVIDQINVPLPASATQAVDLSLKFGAGILKLHPGSASLVSGTATYNVSDFKPTVTVNGSQSASNRATGS